MCSVCTCVITTTAPPFGTPLKVVRHKPHFFLGQSKLLRLQFHAGRQLTTLFLSEHLEIESRATVREVPTTWRWAEAVAFGIATTNKTQMKKNIPLAFLARCLTGISWLLPSVRHPFFWSLRNAKLSKHTHKVKATLTICKTVQ